MQDLLDPNTKEPATETRQTQILQEYLQNKFGQEDQIPDTIYPTKLIPNLEDIEKLIAKADLKKTTGYDYIPYTALKYPKFREILE